MDLDDAKRRWWNRGALVVGKKLGDRPVAPILAGVSTFSGVLVTFGAGWLWPTGISLLLAGLAAYSRDLWRRVDSAQRDKDAASAQKALEVAANTALEKLASDHGQFADVFTELVRRAAEMPDKNKPERASDFAMLVQQTVNAIAWVMHADINRVRAVVYQVSDDNSRMDVLATASSSHRLAPQPFLRGTDRGEKAFATLESGASLFVDDISKAPEQWAGSGDGYNTFITTPISSSTAGYGLLTVDAPETDSLTEDDENDLRLVAAILAVIFAEKGRRSPGRAAGSPA